jgi:MerR family copper efflux transcriptional regulator
MSMSEDAPIACSLSAADRNERGAQWHALLAGAPATRADRSATVVLSSALADRVAALAVAEQECCPFFGFTLDFRGAAVALTIEVPSDDAAPLLDALVATASAG